MKNLTKIFTVVVAGMLAFSCVTDTTEDLGVNIQGDRGVTEVLLSMEAARTHLGEKADGVYPLYWSEGDAIAVNGVASNPLAVVGESTSAAFQFNEVVNYPHCVVYPAPAAVAAEEAAEPTTVYPVTFLATQPYTVGTFAPQAAPMYGYGVAPAEGEEVAPIAMQHLAGVLRFAVVGNGEAVSTLTVKSVSSKLSGAFTVDCTDGTLTADESAANTVTVTFPEGTVLGEEPLVVYVAVPAGKHGEIWATLRTAEDKMTVKFNSDVKPLVAGNVREFAQFTYRANEGDSDDSVFEIDSKEALIEFARIASVFAPRTTAKVVANIDMSGYDWKPIENFGKYTFDGGKAEGFSIDGLNAPLFGTTAATIKNLNLTGVDITTNDIAKLGAIACTINGGSLNNCSASGKIEINNTKLVPSENTWDIISYGGIVGSLTGATVENVTNNVNITLNQVCHTDNVAASYISLGGITGYTTAGTHANVVNNGALTVNSTTNWIAVGGCYGYGADNVTGATNNADITFAKVEGTTVTNIYVGGIYGAAQALSKVNYTVKDMSNTGDIKIYKDATGASYVGGLLGRNGSTTDYSVDIDGATNLGNVDVNCNFGESYFGGIVGRSYGGATINNAVNGNSTNADATSFTVDGTCTGTLQFGGCIGDNKCTVTSMYNYSKVVVNGAISTLSIGGCINYSSGTLNGVYNYGTVEINSNSTAGNLSVGGVVQKNTKPITNVENHGDITVNGTHTAAVYIAGISYDIDSTMENVTNDSTIKFAGACDGSLYIGGLTAAATGSSRTNCTNKGEIIVSGTVGNKDNTGSDCFIGGFCYRSSGGTETWTNCHNEGNITLNSTASVAGSARLAGFIPNAEYANTVMTFDGDCSNSGNITIDGATICAHEATAVASVGGFIASNTAGASLTINDSLVNSGVITIKNTAFGGNTWIAGCFGRTIHALTNVSNTAAINISNVEFKATTYVSGCLGQVNAKVALNDVSNTGAITLDEDCKYKELYIAGCLAEDSDEGGIFTNVTNNAPITVKGGASSFVRLGGVLGWVNAATGHSKLYNYEDGDLHLELTNCTPTSWIRVGGVAVKLQDSHNTTENHGNITIKGVTGTGGLAVAGIVAYPNNYTRTKCVNNSTITIDAQATNLAVGGIACESTDASNYVSCSNSGTINITENCEISGYAYIGGIVSTAEAKDKYVTSSTNSANITFSGTCGGALSIGGCIGKATKYGYISDFTNTGNITYNGSNSAGNVHIGGIFGDFLATTKTDGTQFRGNNINTGNINVTGTCAEAATSYVGGIVGNCAIAISNAKCYAEITGVGYDGTGMITGVAKSDAVALTNCAVGGKITCNAFTGEDAGGVETTIKQTVTLGESSNVDDLQATEWTDYWYKYIYGSNNPASAEEATGVTLLTEAPSLEAPEA